jgi:hypothetical protein
MKPLNAMHAVLLTLCLVATPALAVDDAQGNPAETAPGPLDGNWRVTRADDPFDAALMLMQIRQEGRRIEGDYLLFQPFCGIDLPPAAAGAETCEFDGVSEDVTGRVRGGRATIVFRPGADELPHRLIIPAKPSNGRLEGRYLAPGESVGIAVRLSRPPE